MKMLQITLLAAALGLTACGDRENPDTASGSAQLANDASELAGEAGGKLNQAMQAAKDSAETTMQKTGESVTEMVQDSGAALAETADAASESVKETVTESGSAMLESMHSAGDSAIEAVKPAVEAGSAAVAGVVGSVSGQGDKVMADAGKAAESATAAAGADLSQGKGVYSKYCVACHGSGAAGAPKLTDKADWATRASQGIDTLTTHALKGFQGSKGYMPAKGGFSTLSDAEVSAAIAYMLSESQ